MPGCKILTKLSVGKFLVGMVIGVGGNSTLWFRFRELHGLKDQQTGVL